MTITVSVTMALSSQSGSCQTMTTAQADSLTAAIRQMPDNDTKLATLYDICSGHPNVDSVLKYAMQLANLSSQLNNHRTYARAHQFLGWCYGSKGNYEKALAYHYRALIIYDSIADVVGMARCYISTGEDFLDLKDYYAADEHFHKALDIYNKLGLESEYPSIYRNLGSMYKDYKIFETAKKYFENAIEIDSLLNSTAGLVIDYNYMSETEYDEFQEFKNTTSIELAKRHNEIAYQKAVEINDTSYLIFVLQSSLPICLDYACTLDSAARQDMLDSCVQIYHQAMTISRDYGYENNYYLLESCRAKHLLLNRRYTDCLDQLEKIRKHAEADTNKVTQPFDYNCYIDCYIAMGDYRNALRYKKRKDVSESQEFFLETTLNSSKSSIKEEFEQSLRQQEKEKRNRELLFEEHKKMIRIINRSTSIFIVLLIGFAIVALFDMRNKKANNKTLLRQKDDYETQRNILANINIQITDSIRYAKEIQNAVIPSAAIMNAIFGENLVVWMPIDIVSGNFYWATQKGRFKLLAVADCMRHGVPGAFTSMLGITSLNDIASSEVSDNHCPSASTILGKLRKKIESAIPQQGQSEAANVIDIGLCIIDTENDTMQFAGAHSPLFIVRNGNLTVIDSDNIHIGDTDNEHNEFTNTKIAIRPGDVVYLYTDGIASQLNHEGGQSNENLISLLTSINPLPFDKQSEIINNAINTTASGSVCQADDILLVGIRI